MPQLIIKKTGTHMFDAAHGYGLGIVMAFLSQSSVALADHGTCLHVLYQEPLRTLAANTCIKELLQLPTVETLTQQTASDVTRKNLDGLLAILFTSPGVRAISTNDLLSKGRQNIDVLEQGVAKASTAVERWGKQVARRTSGLEWGSYLLQSYGANSITAPVPVLKENRHITISMTIDPIFSYSTRQAMSDGRVADKTNVSIEGTPDAPILAIIGAARLLGAQRVAHGIVLYWFFGNSRDNGQLEAIPTLVAG